MGAPASGSDIRILLRYSCRFLNSEQFVNAIAPKGDLSKIGRSQFATLFRVADANKRGLVSWDDFVVFETILKRPDADYWIAFQYFDVYACPSAFTVPEQCHANLFLPTFARCASRAV